MSENNYKVYIHINKTNGKRYYGITKQEPKKRWQNGKKYGNNDHFTNAINYYGWGNFDHIVIARGLTEEEAKWLEIELIREFDTTNRDKGYNITKGGEGTNGYKHTEETRKNIGKIHKGKTLSEETRKKLSEAMKGKNSPMKGKTHTEETRKKLSEAMKGKTLSEETRKKLSESHKGKNNPSAKRIYCVELDMYFDTVTEASEYVGCHRSNISSVLIGNRKTCKGYHWLYAEDRNNK